METNNRSFFLMVVVGVLVLGLTGWFVRGIILDSEQLAAQAVQKQSQYNHDFDGIIPLDQLNVDFDQQIAKESALIKNYKKQVFFEFPDWVKKADDLKLKGQVGGYFSNKKTSESDRLRAVCGPECNIDVNPVIASLGFKSGAVPPDDEAKKELRRLAIISKTIDLAAHAKLEQFKADERDKLKNTAYMKICSVEPLKPEFTGAVRLDINPKYREDDKSYRNKRFFIIQYPYFMTEYPIELKMVCDINTFRRFLASTRQPNQYLIIRNIRIRSSTIKMSQEGANDEPSQLSDKDIPDNFESDVVYIELSAAGVEFLDGHRHEDGVTEPLDLVDYLPGFGPKAVVAPGAGTARPKPIGA